MKKVVRKSFVIISLLVLCLAIFACKREATPIGIETDLATEEITKTYYVGEEIPSFNCYLVYSDGNKQLINDYQVSFNVFANEGENMLKVTYKDFSKEISFNAKNPNNIINLYVEEGIYCSDIDNLHFDSLQVYGITMSGKKVLLTDYNLTIDQKNDDGTYNIKVDYNNLVVYFKATLSSKNDLLELISFKNYEEEIKLQDANKTISDIHLSGFRYADYIVYYTKDTYVKTNSFGYEFAINASGFVIDEGINVSLPENGAIISAHGNGKEKIKTNIKVGDYIFVDENSRKIYVFDGTNPIILQVGLFSHPYNLASKVIDELKTLKDDDFFKMLNDANLIITSANQILEYASISYDATNIKQKINSLEKLVNDFEEEYEIIVDNYQPFLSYESTFSYQKINDISFDIDNCSLVKELTINHAGGFRNTNELVLYNQSNLISRNAFGYEVAVSKEGLVVEAGINVKLPAGGFILSGHGDAASALIDYVKINDFIKCQTSKALIYRDSFNGQLFAWKTQVENLIKYVDEAYEKELPLYYGSIEKLCNETIEEINQLNEYANADRDLLINIKRFANNKVDQKIYALYLLSLNQNAVQNKCFWYDFGSLSGLGFSDDSIEAVDNLLAFISKCGFNTIYLACDTHGYVLFKSNLLLPMNDICTKEGQYGDYKDYLECIVEEAKKYNVSIRVWLKAMVGGVAGDLPSNIPENYYCTYLDGTYPTSGHIHYDATNPEVRNFIKDIYLEVVTNYDVDGVELDYIRYEGANTATLKGTVTIDKVDDCSFTDYAISSFMDKYDLAGDFKSLFLKSEDVRSKWMEYKKEGITATVKLISEAISEVKPDCYLTAAVFGANSRFNICQDWPLWLEEGYIDCAEPMLYTNDNETFYKYVNEAKEAQDNNQYLIYGIGPTLRGGEHVQLLEQIRFLEKEMDNYCIFSGVYVFNSASFVKALKQYNNQTVSCHSSREEKTIAIAKLLLDQVNNYYKVYCEGNYNGIINALKDIINNYSIDNYNELLAKINELANENVKKDMLNKLSVVNIG